MLVVQDLPKILGLVRLNQGEIWPEKLMIDDSSFLHPKH